MDYKEPHYGSFLGESPMSGWFFYKSWLCGVWLLSMLLIGPTYNKQLNCRWFETPWRSCDFSVLLVEKIKYVSISAEHLKKYIDFFPFVVNFVNFDHDFQNYPDSKVYGANMGPIWVLSAPDGPHVGPMNLAIRVLHLYMGKSCPSASDAGIFPMNMRKQLEC